MRPWPVIAAAFLMFASAGALANAGGDSTPFPSASDRSAVEKIVSDFESAWNRHDMEDFAALFHDDAEWVHWRGGLWSGRPEIYEGHKAIHEAYYRNTTATVRGIEALHFLAPTIAYVRVRSDMAGDLRSPGETFRYRRTMLISKRDGKWLIIKGHNTRIVGPNDVDWKPSP